jgi:hypothetical protein
MRYEVDPMRLVYLVFPFLVTACAVATTDPNDAEAEAAGAQAVGKADGASFSGLYHAHATSLKPGDVPTLELRVTAKAGAPTLAYVRARCYHTGCTLDVPETDSYDVYTSSGGKTYVRFWSEQVSHDGNGDLVSTPVVADVYEIKTTSKGIKLRKSFTARWLNLYSTSEETLCEATGGSWGAGACGCPGNTPGEFATYEFIAGAGGCIATPGADESNCDASDGMWTDDDATLIGSYCVCGLDRHVDDTGSCSSN